jgi:hypothetical protein
VLSLEQKEVAVVEGDAPVAFCGDAAPRETGVVELPIRLYFELQDEPSIGSNFLLVFEICCFWWSVVGVVNENCTPQTSGLDQLDEILKRVC